MSICTVGLPSKVKVGSSIDLFPPPRLASYIKIGNARDLTIFLGWSQTELVNIINKDPFPNPNAVDDYRNALFQCGGSDNPFFVGYCNRGCVNEGSGHDDVCRGEC